MEELTKVEERIMQQLWSLKKAFVKDIIAHLPDDPKPPYNTVSSVIRILVSKGYVQYKAYGKTYEYYPAVSKAEYRKLRLRKMITGYFGDSPASLVSHIVREEELSKEEILELKKLIEKME
ncbi:MAG: BlaI/MecI/CopY family transcriptional regulator [Bacteroidales bacterium]